jgi:hypothetical protein
MVSALLLLPNRKLCCENSLMFLPVLQRTHFIIQLVRDNILYHMLLVQYIVFHPS